MIKNALLFLKELFNNELCKNNNFYSHFIKVVLPAVLIKTCYEKNFIVIEAKKCLSYAISNCTISETVDVFVEGCNTKNGVLAELSMGYLGDLIKKMDKKYYEECGESVHKLVKQLNIEIDGKRMKMKKSAETIIKDLKSLIG